LGAKEIKEHILANVTHFSQEEQVEVAKQICDQLPF
jgi:hypothetical protein